jgi:hypothetical protein
MTQQGRTNQAKDQTKDKDKDLAKDKPSTKSAREIESEIGETRAAITSDIRELNEKFSSANVKESAKEVMSGVKDAAVEQAVEMKDVVVNKAIEVKDAVVDKAVEMKDAASEKVVEAKDAMLDTMEDVGEQMQRAGSASWRFAQANAIPLTLLGVGAAWMIANNRRGPVRRREPERLYRPDYTGEVWSEDEEAELYARPGPQRRIASDLGPARSSGSRSSPRSGASTSARISSRAHDLKDQATDGLVRAEHAIADSASRGAEYVQNSLRRAGTASREFAGANPIFVAMAAIAAGVGVGMLLPSTESEDRLLGPTRAKFQDILGDVKDAATDVAQVAKDTANESMNSLT